MTTDQIRLEVNINTTTAEHIKTYAERRGLTATESVRHLTTLGALVADTINDGGQVLLRRKRFGFWKTQKVTLL